MNRRFNALARVVIETVDTNDAFGLRIRTQQQELTAAPSNAFDFVRSSDKIDAFMRWLQQQEEKGILELATQTRIGGAIEQPWTNLYVFDSYKRGVIRAQQELRKAGYPVPAIADQGGIEAVLASPFHVDRLGVLYTRAFTELRGITQTMDTQISRILAQGLADGDNPNLLARKLVTAINTTATDALGLDITYINPRTGNQVSYFMPGRRRAQILARTEVINAHHQAMMQEYKNWRADNFIIIAEFTTAGDDRVCTICEGFSGDHFTLEEIEHLIPVHPQCRCIAIPVRKEEVINE
jgi:SPP1 gp7 family putative phage head morphogenesis protein